MQCNVVSEGIGVNSGPGGGWTQLRAGGSQFPPFCSGVGIPSCLLLWKILGSRKGIFLKEGAPNSCKKIQITIAMKAVNPQTTSGRQESRPRQHKQ